MQKLIDKWKPILTYVSLKDKKSVPVELWEECALLLESIEQEYPEPQGGLSLFVE